jgi:hypothetical protein
MPVIAGEPFGLQRSVGDASSIECMRASGIAMRFAASPACIADYLSGMQLALGEQHLLPEGASL